MKVALAVASTLVTAMMLAMPVSAGAKSVSFEDRQGDLGKSWYGYDGDPVSWWSGDSPISYAGYLDIRTGWVTSKGDSLTMGLMVDSPLTASSVLPDGVSQVRWAWFFYLNTEHFWADYGVLILWDGTEFSAALMDRTSGSPPFTVADLNEFTVDGQMLTVTISASSIAGAVAWFSETMVMHGSPWPLDQWPSSGAWHAPDITDWTDTTMALPWLPMI